MYGAERVIVLPQSALEQDDVSRGGLDEGLVLPAARANVASIDSLVVEPLRTRTLVGANEPDAGPVDVPARAHRLPYAYEAQTDVVASQQLTDDLTQERQILAQ